MKKYFCLIFVILFCLSCASHRAKVGDQNILSLNKIQHAVDEAQNKGHLPGIGVLAWSKGKTLYFSVQGKRAIQHPQRVELQDQWHLGSDTKAMTAFLIALASQRGLLSYDSKIYDLLKHPKMIHPQNKGLTVSDLLTHSSGLKDVQEIQGGQLWKGDFTSKQSTTNQRLEMVYAGLAEAPHSDPKNKDLPQRTFSYANVNYLILGAALEEIYKTDWESLIQNELFSPLQMTSCGFGPAGDPEETLPSQRWPHLIYESKLVGVPPKGRLDNPAMMGPAGTIHCNLEDWRKFITELVAASNGEAQLLKDKKVIGKYFSSPNDSHYTFGAWGQINEKNGGSIFTHDGSNKFNYASALFSPKENSGFLITTNSGTPEAVAAIRKISSFLTSSLLIP